MERTVWLVSLAPASRETDDPHERDQEWHADEVDVLDAIALARAREGERRRAAVLGSDGDQRFILRQPVHGVEREGEILRRALHEPVGDEVRVAHDDQSAGRGTL